MNDTDALDDLRIIACTGWGENRGLGRMGMQATINTGQNRVASGRTWWGRSLRDVFLHPYQYSCWNAGDPNRPKLMAVTEADPQFTVALDLGAAALAGSLPDITNGADSYVAGSLQVLPAWARGLTALATINGTRFFRTI